MGTKTDYTQGAILYTHEASDLRYKFIVDTFYEFGSIVEIVLGLSQIVVDLGENSFAEMYNQQLSELKQLQNKYRDCVQKISELEETKNRIPGIQKTLEDLREENRQKLIELEQLEKTELLKLKK